MQCPRLKKSKTVNLRIEPEAHDLIARAAEVCGKSITAFMTEASVYSAQEELLDQRFIGVSSDVFEVVSEQADRSWCGARPADASCSKAASSGWIELCHIGNRRPISDRHMLTEFESGKAPLDAWLKDMALYNQAQGYTRDIRDSRRGISCRRLSFGVCRHDSSQRRFTRRERASGTNRAASRCPCSSGGNKNMPGQGSRPCLTQERANERCFGGAIGRVPQCRGARHR